MDRFDINLTFTPESVTGVQSGYENTLGGIEYRIEGRDIVAPDSVEEPSTMDYLGMAIQSLLVAANNLLENEPGYIAYHEFEAYLVLNPTRTQTVLLGVSRNSWEEAIKRAESGKEISLETLVDEALETGELYLTWLDNQDAVFRTRTYSRKIKRLINELENKRGS